MVTASLLAAVKKLNELPRDSSASRQRNRCAITGRDHGYYRKFGLGRNKLREAAMRGEIAREAGALLREGYGVLGVFMPHMRPGDCTGGHDAMFRMTNVTGSAIKFFLELLKLKVPSKLKAGN